MAPSPQPSRRPRWARGVLVVVVALALGGAQAAGAGRTEGAARAAQWEQAPMSPAPGPARPLPAGFDVRQLEAMARALVVDKHLPGLAMAVVHDGQVLSMRGYGTTDVDTGQAVDRHTVFRLASLSKAFAGTVAGMLVAEGALRWDAPMADYRPDLALERPGAARALTVADVLSQRTGLVSNAHDTGIEDGQAYATLVGKLGSTPMVCDPGACYTYQNVAFSLSADAVLAASGHYFAQTVASRIFEPLGMGDASYGREGLMASARWARPHVMGRGGWVSLDAPKPTYYRVAPAAGVNASVSDMTQWMLAQLGRRPDVLPYPVLATLHAPVVSTPSEIRGNSWRRARIRQAGYAMGWRVYDYAGHTVVFHGGAVEGYRTAIALVPELGFGIVVLANNTSSQSAYLIPEALDRALGLRGHWLHLD